MATLSLGLSGYRIEVGGAEIAWGLARVSLAEQSEGCLDWRAERTDAREHWAIWFRDREDFGFQEALRDLVFDFLANLPGPPVNEGGSPCCVEQAEGLRTLE